MMTLEMLGNVTEIIRKHFCEGELTEAEKLYYNTHIDETLKFVKTLKYLYIDVAIRKFVTNKEELE